MPRTGPKIGVERALKVKARASTRNTKHPPRVRAVADSLWNQRDSVLARVRHRELCRLLKEVELMMALAEQCLEVVQHWIEQHEKRPAVDSAEEL